MLEGQQESEKYPENDAREEHVMWKQSKPDFVQKKSLIEKLASQELTRFWGQNDKKNHFHSTYLAYIAGALSPQSITRDRENGKGARGKPVCTRENSKNKSIAHEMHPSYI